MTFLNVSTFVFMGIHWFAWSLDRIPAERLSWHAFAMISHGKAAKHLAILQYVETWQADDLALSAAEWL